MENKFRVISKYKPTGDQPQAIEKIAEGFQQGKKFQTLVGVTGSGQQQDPCGTAIQRTEGILPGKCGRIFCILL